MNNDNLKRVLNKISGADRASVQQKTPPGYEQNDDMDFQINPTETPTEKERTELKKKNIDYLTYKNISNNSP